MTRAYSELPDWIAALEYPGMFWTGVAVLSGFAAYMAWGIRQIIRTADEYDEGARADSDDDLGIGA